MNFGNIARGKGLRSRFLFRAMRYRNYRLFFSGQTSR